MTPSSIMASSSSSNSSSTGSRSQQQPHNNNNKEITDDQIDDNNHNNNNGSNNVGRNVIHTIHTTGSINNSSKRNSSNTGDIPLIELASNEIEQMRKQRRQQTQIQIQKQNQQINETNNSTISNNNNNNNTTTNLSYHTFPSACLLILKSIDGNNKCIDCNERNPQWAAVRYGAMVCLKCSGHHRSFGVSISTIRSITMDDWTFEEILCMLEGGNTQLLSFFNRHALTYDNNTTTTTTTTSNNTSTSTCAVTSNVPSKNIPSISQSIATPISTTTTPTPTPTAATIPSTDTNTNTTTSSNTRTTTAVTTITKDNVIRMRYKTKAALFYRKQLEIHIANVLNSGPYRGREISRRLKHHPLDKRNTSSTLE